MRENRPYGSEGGEAQAFPTPIGGLGAVFLEPGFQVGGGLEVEQGVGEGAKDVGRKCPDGVSAGPR